MERRVAELRQKQRKGVDGSRVVYVGRIPHGFYEDQMKAFLSQFGVVKRLRISRNKKTGHSKHYGFVEFESAEVASIVAECMHNYLLEGHILQARLMPAERQHAKLWKGANKKFRVVPRRLQALEEHNKERTPTQAQKLLEKQLKNEDLRRKKLAAASIDYDFVGLREKIPEAPVHVTFGKE